MTRTCLEFIAANQPQFHDQTAMNVLFRENVMQLPGNYNIRTNAREDWWRLKRPANGSGCVLHFVDYPKPWDPFALFFHPMGSTWKGCLKQTALYGTPELKKIRGLRPFRMNQKTLKGYRKSGKDTVLFKLYSRGLIRQVKGMSMETGE